MKKQLVYLGYAIAWQVLKLLPEKAAYNLGNRVADYAYRKNGKGVRRLRSNYQKILGNAFSSEKISLRSFSISS